MASHRDIAPKPPFWGLFFTESLPDRGRCRMLFCTQLLNNKMGSHPSQKREGWDPKLRCQACSSEGEQAIEERPIAP